MLQVVLFSCEGKGKHLSLSIIKTLVHKRPIKCSTHVENSDVINSTIVKQVQKGCNSLRLCPHTIFVLFHKRKKVMVHEPVKMSISGFFFPL